MLKKIYSVLILTSLVSVSAIAQWRDPSLPNPKEALERSRAIQLNAAISNTACDRNAACIHEAVKQEKAELIEVVKHFEQVRTFYFLTAFPDGCHGSCNDAVNEELEKKSVEELLQIIRQGSN